jgi:hypothetical protein
MDADEEKLILYEKAEVFAVLVSQRFVVLGLVWFVAKCVTLCLRLVV